VAVLSEEGITLLEIDYTPYDNACKDPAVIEGQTVECRRHLHHNRMDSKHATRFGGRLVSWSYAGEEIK
jgi:hypothetical protein